MPDVLHSIRTLLCTATNCTPHERLFNFQRRSGTGTALPSWLLNPGTVLLRRFVRQSKYEPFVDEVELIEANPQYAHVRFPDGRESTVSIKDLAPTGEVFRQSDPSEPSEEASSTDGSDTVVRELVERQGEPVPGPRELTAEQCPDSHAEHLVAPPVTVPYNTPPIAEDNVLPISRRSSRTCKPTQRLITEV